MKRLEAARRRNRFEKGSGCYTCRVCSRRTRSTGCGDNEGLQLCIECFEVAGIENEIADEHYRNDAEKAELEATIAKLNAKCRVKGGKV